MTSLPALAAASAWNRRGTLSLVALSIALATLLLLSFERVRLDVRDNFTSAVSGTDLVVGARTGPIQLMLYAVFRLGGATNSIRMDSVRAVEQHRAVAWVVPLSLGDSHRGFPVLGTTTAYFERFRYGEQQPLVLAQGSPFSGDLDGLYGAVLGAEVAQRLNYALGSSLVLAHGSGTLPGSEHADKPFTVVGILAPTGTPVDRTVHISLQALEAIHLDWSAGVPMKGLSIPAEQARKFDLEPKQVTAALVGLKGRAAVFNVQRFVNEYEGEPLMAVLPGVALDELWTVVGVGEKLLLALSGLVALVSLAGLVATVLAGLNERRRELAVLRAVGAGPRHVLMLLALEGLLVTLAGVALGVLASTALIGLACPWVQSTYGIALTLAAPSATQWLLLAGVLAAGVLASLVPGVRAYRLSLADGLAPRRCRGGALNRRLILLMALALAAPLAPAQDKPAARAGHTEITWDELVPADWDPLQQFKDMNFGVLSDADPRAAAMLKKMREVWDNAPVNNKMDGRAIRIPGYIVPLEEGKNGMTEFLLVPYFGACIHSPPPPANQIIHVKPKAPAKGFKSMDTVWVDGTLRTLRSDTFMGVSSYRMDAVGIERYVEKPAK